MHGVVQSLHDRSFELDFWSAAIAKEFLRGSYIFAGVLIIVRITALSEFTLFLSDVISTTTRCLQHKQFSGNNYNKLALKWLNGICFEFQI